MMEYLLSHPETTMLLLICVNSFALGALFANICCLHDGWSQLKERERSLRKEKRELEARKSIQMQQSFRKI